MSQSYTETALATTSEQNDELQVTSASARAQHEIQSAIIIAKRFPRDESQAYAKLMKSCKRRSFAESSNYKFPRGGATVTGPSVNLAREAARVWGNIRYGIEIVRDDNDSRLIRAFGWDVETNSRVEQEDEFEKLVQRKKDGKTAWVVPDERDLRELTNKRGAIALRNCLLQLLPKDFIEDAIAACEETLRSEASKDPDAEIKRIIMGFQELRITPAMLKQYLGHEVSQCSPAEIADLRGIWKSIADGNTTWTDYSESDQVAEASRSRLDDLKAKKTPADPTQAPAQTSGQETVQSGQSQHSSKPSPRGGDQPHGVPLNFGGRSERSSED